MVRIERQQFQRMYAQFLPLSQVVEREPSFVGYALVEALWHQLLTGENVLPNDAWDAALYTSVRKTPAYEQMSQQTTRDVFLTTLVAWRCSVAIARWAEQSVKVRDVSRLTATLQEAILQSLEAYVDVERQTVERTAKGVADLLSGLTHTVGNGAQQKVPIVHQLHVAEQLVGSADLMEIAAWAGRFKVVARLTKKSRQIPTILKQGTRNGQAAERLLPIEYLKSEDPDAMLDFMHRFTEGRTTMYDYKKRQKPSKGAFVVCYDESSSMKDLDKQGKGFILAILAIAQKEKRDFVFIPFSGDVGHRDIRVFKKGRYTVDDILAVATSYIGGGTSFQAPLQEAMFQLRTSTKHADLVFITDGTCHIEETFIETFNTFKKRRHVEMLTLIIGRNKHPGLLPNISDDLKHIVHFEDEAGYMAFTL